MTVSEKMELPDTIVTLRFVNDVTKSTVTIVSPPDLSGAVDRYNMYQVDTALFDNMDNGFYTYHATDQAGNILEVGKMKLVGEKAQPVQYQDTPTDYKTYGE